MPYTKKHKELYEEQKHLTRTEKNKLAQDRYNEKKELTHPEWERQAEETMQNWDAFKMYRDMGLTRSLGAVARALTTKEKYKGKYQVILTWSYRWRWTDRLIAYQRHIDAIYLEETQKSVKEMAVRHADYAKNTMQSLYVPIMEFGRKFNMINEARKIAKLQGREFVDIDSDIENMTLKELLNLVYKSAPLLSVTADMERKSRGEPTDISSRDITTGGEAIKPDIKVVVNGTQSTILREFENNF